MKSPFEPPTCNPHNLTLPPSEPQHGWPLNDDQQGFDGESSDFDQFINVEAQSVRVDEQLQSNHFRDDNNLTNDDTAGALPNALQPDAAGPSQSNGRALVGMGTHFDISSMPTDEAIHGSFLGLSQGSGRCDEEQELGSSPRCTSILSQGTNATTRGRKNPLNDEQKRSANETREKGACICCKHRKTKCDNPQTPCEPCIRHRRPCFRTPDKISIPGLASYPTDLWLRSCRALAPDLSGLSLVICLRLMIGSQQPKLYRVGLTPLEMAKSSSEHCSSSGIHTKALAEFVGKFSAAIMQGRPVSQAKKGDVSIQAFADRSLTYAILLSKLPHALCARFHQVLDLQKMRCIIVALYVCLLQSLTASLHKLLCKVVELTLPTTLKKCPRQDHVLGALAIMDRVTQMLTDLHLDESCRMFSILGALAAEVRTKREELRLFCEATFHSIRPNEDKWPSLDKLEEIVWPDSSGIDFQISYSSSKLQDVPALSESRAPADLPDPQRLFRESMDPPWIADHKTADNILMNYASEYAIQDPKSPATSPSEAVKIQRFENEADSVLRYIDPRILDLSNQEPQQKTLTRRSSDELDPSAGVLFSCTPRVPTPPSTVAEPTIEVDSLAVEPTVSGLSGTNNTLSDFSWDPHGKRPRSVSPPTTVDAQWKRPRALTESTGEGIPPGALEHQGPYFL